MDSSSNMGDTRNWRINVCRFVAISMLPMKIPIIA
jgi:hypothetical protein